MDTIDEIAAGEGVTIKSIGDLLRASTYKRFNDDVMRIAWKNLKKIFPGIEFNYPGFSFPRPYDKKEMPINALLSRSFFKTSEHESDKFLQVRSLVNLLLNKKKEIDEKTSDVYISRVYERIKIAIGAREQHKKGKHGEFCKAAASLVGLYPFDDKHQIGISNTAIDIFMKSTGQEWEQESCERVGGQFDAGIYSDIEWCNLVAFIYANDEDMPIARVMIRTCETDDGNPSFGVETVYYTNEGRMPLSEGGDIDGIRLVNINIALFKIIEEKGFAVDYDACTTPYEYAGYSDRAHRGGGVTINYGNPPFNARAVFRLNAEFAARCPYCDTCNEWEIEIYDQPSAIDEEVIEKAMKKLDGQIIDHFHVNDVTAEEIDEGRFGIHSGKTPCNCVTCGARIIFFDFDKFKSLYKEIVEATIKKHHMHQFERSRTFGYFPLLSKLKILAFQNKEIRDYIMQLFDIYPHLVKKLITKDQRIDFAYFVMKKSVITDAVRKQRARYPRKKYDEPPFKIKDRYNYGESRDIGDGEYYIYIKPENIDLASIVQAYARLHFKQEPIETLTMKKMTDAQLKKFKKLDTFCKRA